MRERWKKSSLSSLFDVTCWTRMIYGVTILKIIVTLSSLSSRVFRSLCACWCVLKCLINRVIRLRHGGAGKGFSLYHMVNFMTSNTLFLGLKWQRVGGICMRFDINGAQICVKNTLFCVDVTLRRFVIPIEWHLSFVPNDNFPAIEWQLSSIGMTLFLNRNDTHLCIKAWFFVWQTLLAVGRIRIRNVTKYRKCSQKHRFSSLYGAKYSNTYHFLKKYMVIILFLVWFY